ncbi:MAG: ribosome small subunit-dependent GTPase A [Spirochaetota bacterium]
MNKTATVLTGRNNIFTVEMDGRRYLCRIKGKSLALEERSHNPLAPGDLVTVAEIDETHATGVIVERSPRRNAFQRYNRKRAALQTLAANVDLVVVVMSADHPAFRNRFVDRVLVLAEHHEIAALVAVTKADLDGERAIAETDRYRGLGYEAIALRRDVPETLETLRAALEDKRSVFVGQSGVGKSTILNRLVGSELQETGEVSSRYLRGRHTTNAAVLVSHDRIQIVDTPGVRELDCRHVPPEELDHAFRDFRPFLGRCAHNDCSHTEDSGCAVLRAVADGALDATRHESYVRLFAEIESAQEEYP